MLTGSGRSDDIIAFLVSRQDLLEALNGIIGTNFSSRYPRKQVVDGELQLNHCKVIARYQIEIRKLTRENKGLKEQIKAIGGLTDNSIDPVDVNANV